MLFSLRTKNSKAALNKVMWRLGHGCRPHIPVDVTFCSAMPNWQLTYASMNIDMRSMWPECGSSFCSQNHTQSQPQFSGACTQWQLSDHFSSLSSNYHRLLKDHASVSACLQKCAVCVMSINASFEVCFF